MALSKYGFAHSVQLATDLGLNRKVHCKRTLTALNNRHIRKVDKAKPPFYQRQNFSCLPP